MFQEHLPKVTANVAYVPKLLLFLYAWTFQVFQNLNNLTPWKASGRSRPWQVHNVRILKKLSKTFGSSKIFGNFKNKQSGPFLLKREGLKKFLQCRKPYDESPWTSQVGPRTICCAAFTHTRTTEAELRKLGVIMDSIDMKWIEMMKWAHRNHWDLFPGFLVPHPWNRQLHGWHSAKRFHLLNSYEF